jgi:hypothetical protein
VKGFVGAGNVWDDQVSGHKASGDLIPFDVSVCEDYQFMFRLVS